MAQMVYAILAILLVAFLALNMNRATMQSEHQMIVNEVATQVTGIGTDVIEYIGRRAFDENTIEEEDQEYPVVTSANGLTPEETGFGGCTEFSYTASPGSACDDIDDYDGLVFTRTVGGLEYEVSVSVRYVDPDTHEPTGGGRTFTKEVVVSIASPHLMLGSQPLSVSMSRVFAYSRHTSSS